MTDAGNAASMAMPPLQQVTNSGRPKRKCGPPSRLSPNSPSSAGHASSRVSQQVVSNLHGSRYETFPAAVPVPGLSAWTHGSSLPITGHTVTTAVVEVPDQPTVASDQSLVLALKPVPPPRGLAQFLGWAKPATGLSPAPVTVAQVQFAPHSASINVNSTAPIWKICHLKCRVSSLMLFRTMTPL